ncbi:MAG: hypothetical protein PHO94_12485, partial [Petrimonas sp.]|nr:hypothetical protein [Petrimonas sp.]
KKTISRFSDECCWRKKEGVSKVSLKFHFVMLNELIPIELSGDNLIADFTFETPSFIYCAAGH